MLGERLETLLAPDSVVIYGRADEVFAPLYESGCAVAPSFAADGPLALELELARRVLDVETATAGGADDPLLRSERGALDAMGSELVVPVLLRDRLEAFACLGSKRSGTVYGASELALLQSVADKAADELRRFALEEVHRDQRAMCDRLRRYVPGALAARMEDGIEPPTGEREVSVLFVDIRGYVGLVERSDPRSVFSFVNRYAGLLSQIFARHGGTIIDVQGDGLMAVFGAPESHAEKERAALATAREILAAIRALSLDEANAGDPVDIGIGIATGPAFAGTLRTADRSIWAVVGNTVNLAARCQALTREMDASIVVDARSWTAAGEPADFEPRPATAIRGRRERVDLHLLPHPGRAARAAASEEPA
jgi:class 3 adenylate cyclase